MVGLVLGEDVHPPAVVERLRPLLGCSRGEFDAAVPLLEQIAVLVQRGADCDGWLSEVERVLVANGVDSPAALGHARTLARYSTRASANTVGEVRGLADHRCSDARLLVRVLCDAAGHVSAGLVLHVLDPLLVLGRIRDDIRAYGDGEPGRGNLVTEYVRLFGADRASQRMRAEQEHLVRTLLHRWERLPRGLALALWAVVFDESERKGLLSFLPTAVLVRWAGRRLAASAFSAPCGENPAPDEFRIVPAEERHYEVVAALREASNEQLGARDSAESIAVATRIDLAAGELRVITEGPDIIGSVVIARRGAADTWTAAERAQPCLYASGLVIDRRRSGPLTGRVVEYLRQRAAQQGIRWLRIEVDSECSGLLQYYRKVGFEQVREVSREWGSVRALQLATL